MSVCHLVAPETITSSSPSIQCSGTIANSVHFPHSRDVLKVLMGYWAKNDMGMQFDMKWRAIMECGMSESCRGDNMNQWIPST